jgi:hypothetical protein
MRFKEFMASMEMVESKNIIDDDTKIVFDNQSAQYHEDMKRTCENVSAITYSFYDNVVTVVIE